METNIFGFEGWADVGGGVKVVENRRFENPV